MSATLPIGTKKTVHARRNDVRTQPEVGASIASSLAIAGTATPTVDSEEDVRKPERAATRSTKRLEVMRRVNSSPCIKLSPRAPSTSRLPRVVSLDGF